MDLSETNGGRKKALSDGMRDAIPIGLGYLAVAFSLGIVAKNAGITVIQSFFTSLFCIASAGEYAGFVLIAANAAYIEVAIMTLVVNARYMLMSCALSQKISPKEKLRHRFFTGYFITDEFFGISMARQGYLNPYYVYGAAITAVPMWAIGTALGNVAGNLLPLRVVSALSVALYGMFIAIIIPPARKNKVIAGLVVVCFALSYIASLLPITAKISSGTVTIILTVATSFVAAILFPRNDETEGEE
jgi:predicted branched-subunit amino acid permease